MQYGMPFNATTLSYAYDSLKKDGTAKPIELEPEPAPEPPPPSLRGGGSSDLVPVNADNLSNDELERLLRSKGML